MPDTAAYTLSPLEAARRGGVSDTTIRRWIRSGALPAVRIGPPPNGRLRVALADVLALSDPPAVVEPVDKRP